MALPTAVPSLTITGPGSSGAIDGMSAATPDVGSVSLALSTRIQNLPLLAADFGIKCDGATDDRARQAAQADAERSSVAQRGVDDALRAVRGRGETDALDAATLAAQGVRDAAAQGRTAYRGAYDEVAQIPATFTPGALDRLGARVRDRLGADVPIDPVLTPAATRAISDLDALPGLFNLQPGEGPSLRQLDQVRKRLVAYRGTTGQSPTDRRAVDPVTA
ncbi:hypothetical protein ACQKQD_31485 [Methylobacterium sp. NPDC080182]|uniref:hypothetical protein n=1 Tax=Methylobacterium sp. NPDC080182 TaxID=3390590 RepID=UPI003CFF0886